MAAAAAWAAPRVALRVRAPPLALQATLASTISHASYGDPTASDLNREVHRKPLEVISERNSAGQNTNAAAIGLQTPMSNNFSMLLEGEFMNPSDGSGLAEIKKIINQRLFSR